MCSSDLQLGALRVTQECAELISEVISADAGLSRDQSMVLAVSLVGMAQVSARYWLAWDHPTLTQDQAADLVASLSWRGIRGFPRTDT